MNLDRPTVTPKFVEYAISYALKSAGHEWSDELKGLDPNPIQIPTYQRKIVWDEDTIENFLDSKAVIFGTVILAKSQPEEPLVLLDGLQRFATSTAILHYLHTVILSRATASDEEYFRILVASTKGEESIIIHNHNELKNNSRRGIQDSYNQLYDNVRSVMEKLKKESIEKLAEKLIQTFNRKQIAIDTYHGFKNTREYTQTFININSTGMDLTQVDLLRAEIIQQAGIKRWIPSDIDDVENRFTEVFQSSKIKGTKVLGKHMYDALMKEPTKIFENWEQLDKDDVDNLLDFIEETHKASLENDENGNKKWPYLHENFQCGDIPFSIIMWFYYKKFQNNEKPDFLGGQLDTDDDLRVLLRAFYRRIIGSSMNRADGSASKLIHGSVDFNSMEKIANDVNPCEEKLDEYVDEYWIKTNIKKSNLNKLKRIFNACLLPTKNSAQIFQPLQYGSGNGWSIDHLIQNGKQTKNNEEHEYIETVMNKIPTLTTIKKSLKNNTCLEKIKSDDMCDIKDLHPYLEWLIETHCTKYESLISKDGNTHVLNLPKYLSDTSDPPIGTDRLEKITELLHNRI